MPTIISQDTTWQAGQTIVLNDEVQIASGVTLTIEPGAVIEGGSIRAFGTLSAHGTDQAPILFDGVRLTYDGDYTNTKGRLDLDHVQLDGGSFLRPEGNARYGSFSLTNSVVSHMSDYSYVWYPEGESELSGNVFLDHAWSIGIDGRGTGNHLHIHDNVFSGGSLTNWANYGGSGLEVNSNSYIGSQLAIQYDSGLFDTPDSYFGTTDYAAIQAIITDKADDLRLAGYIGIAGYLDSAPATNPTSLFSFVTVTLPSQVVRDGRLVGTANADLIGNSLDNTLVGNSGNNKLKGSAGSDSINGGLGVDSAVYDGSRTDYSFSRQPDGSLSVAGFGFTDTLTGIEMFEFASGTFSLAEVTNRAPTLTGSKELLASGSEDTSYNISSASLLAGFSDADANTMSVFDLKADHGSVKANGDGTFTVTPSANYNGAISLSFGVSDGIAVTQANQSFILSAVNDAPVITSNKGEAKASVSIAENKQAVTTLNAADVDGDTLGWSLSGKDAALFTVEAGQLSFKAAPDFEIPKDAGSNNTYDVVMTVSDGKLFDMQALAIKVTNVAGKIISGSSKANTLVGTGEEDDLFGNGGGDTLKGGAGDDWLSGGRGADKLYGGDGKKGIGQDTFAFELLTDSTVAAKGRDTIYDFARGDQFDLSALDANGKRGGNQAFSFIDTGKFSGKAGELRYEKAKRDTYVYADTNGDKKADFSFHLDDAVKLAKADFLL